jgi:hypothetical protein
MRLFNLPISLRPIDILRIFISCSFIPLYLLVFPSLRANSDLANIQFLISVDLLLAYFFQSRLMRSPIMCICVCESSPPHKLLNVWSSLYKTWYICVCVYNGNWANLSCPHKSFPSLCVSVCVFFQSLQGKRSVKYIYFHSVLGNGSVNMLPHQRIYSTIEELLDASFSMIPVLYQKSPWICASPYRC